MAVDLKALLKAMPVVLTTVDPRLGAIASLAEGIVSTELARARESKPETTLEDLIAEREQALASLAKSDINFDAGLLKANEWLKKGHETE